jgi:light-regulated signal transduction histidine kinase (bacteriophytochrome)
VLNIEVEGDPKAGSKGHRYWLTGFYPVINERTKLVDFVGAVVFEITDRKEAEKAVQTINERLENLVTERTRELQETNKELQRSNEDLQRFAHVASHDLKEPVRKIKMFSGRLKSEFASELPPKARGYIDKIESAVERMYNMIDGVLMYSSLNAMKQTVEKIDMNKIIQEIQMDLEIIVQQKKARILYDNLPSIYGSTLLVYQLFYNLIGNSLKFTKPGRNPVIRITCEEISDVSGSYFKIRIADNGIGFAQHDSERIFQTFSRLNPKDKFEGTGLGLTLCKNIVERHGGRIWAEGRDDEGATFVVELPVHP